MNTIQRVYFTSLEVENVRCFGEKQRLDLTIEGQPAQWTLIVGENGVGKTTLLQSLGWMSPVPWFPDTPSGKAIPEEASSSNGGTLRPSLTETENEVLETIRRDKWSQASLGAQLAYGEVSLYPYTGVNVESGRGQPIEVGIDLLFQESGRLRDTNITKSTPLRDCLSEWDDGPLVVAYGANRYVGERNLNMFTDMKPLEHKRLSHFTELCDMEELMMALDYGASSGGHEKEKEALGLLKDAVVKVLPEEPAAKIKVYPPDVLGTGRTGGVIAKTFTGQVPLSQLSLGYRSTTGWIVDLAWRLLNHFPDSLRPLEEPAVVIIDEIDLHLHPLWQLTIMRDLSNLFPATQFIASSHSPLVVQVARRAKLALLSKEEGQVKIDNDQEVPGDLRVDQILTDVLFRVPSSRSPEVQQLFVERAALLGKAVRTADEEIQLQEVRRRIGELHTEEDPEDRAAMDLIHRFAASLERERDETR